MKYRLCPNVVLEEVCGIHLLIACGEAVQSLDYVRVLNDTGAEILVMVEKGMSIEEIVHELSIQYEMDELDIRSGITRFLVEMETVGYLLPTEGGCK